MVEPDGPGALRVAWELEGGDEGVDVAVGPTPDRIDHVHAISVESGASSTRLSGLVPGRRYVSVAPRGGGSAAVGAERRLQFEGLQNFRDLGGYPTSGGGRTRWGRVFRSDSLHKLTAADLVAFEQLGLRVVYDLRGDAERETNPNPVDSIQLAIVGRPPAPAGERRDLSELAATTDGEQMLRDVYLGMLVHSAQLFGQLLAGLVGPEGLPAVFHCHAGKDRTGVTAALLLLALGVGRDEVLDDYELTRRYRTLDHQQDSLANLLALGMSPEAAVGVLAAPRWTMAAALDALDTVHGGIETYLTGPAGLTRAQLAELRRLLVVDTAV
jgi:protein-tyrosine phosphatase